MVEDNVADAASQPTPLRRSQARRRLRKRPSVDTSPFDLALAKAKTMLHVLAFHSYTISQHVELAVVEKYVLTKWLDVTTALETVCTQQKACNSQLNIPKSLGEKDNA